MTKEKLLKHLSKYNIYLVDENYRENIEDEIYKPININNKGKWFELHFKYNFEPWKYKEVEIVFYDSSDNWIEKYYDSTMYKNVYEDIKKWMK